MSRRAVALALLAAASGAAAAPDPGPSAGRYYVGEARAPQDGRLLYEEHHLLRRRGERPQQRVVLYRCADGTAFARKQVRYAGAAQAPEFELEDARSGYREGVRRAPAALEVFVREHAAAEERRARLADAAALVVDAGFDEFVRAQYPRLARGDAVALRFLVPSRLQAPGFRLRRRGAETVDGEAASRFTLGLGGVLGWFAPRIDLVYRDRDRRLLRFEGLTNLPAGADGNLTAHIAFPPPRERPATAADWQAAQREPLRPCRPGA